MFKVVNVVFLLPGFHIFVVVLFPVVRTFYEFPESFLYFINQDYPSMFTINYI